MARAIERIEQDIAALQEAIKALAAELKSIYASYLTILGQAVRQQLILASYHVCTQGYPEAFLNLSFKQREQLQQSIRKLAQQTAEQLQSYIRNEEEQEASIAGEVGEAEETETFSAPDPLSLEEPATPASLFPKIPITPDPSNPIELAKWQQHLEGAIALTLKIVSRDANLLLQQAGILPKKLPEPILEAAAAANEAVAEAIPGPPNLLNLLVEIQTEEKSADSSVTQLITIHLRLAEIEFADLMLSSGRNQIRNLLVQLNKLGREYQKKQRERASAEAEAAWRASWFDEF